MAKTKFGRFFEEVGERIGSETGLADIAKGFREGNPDLALRGMEHLRGGPRPFLDTDPVRDKWIATNTSYSGTDVVPIIQINGTLVALGGVQTISISCFREKEPVRTLGRSWVKGYTAGPRTVAGSITFVIFNRDPFWDIIKHLNEDIKTPTDRYSTPVGDQIPPVNLILWFSNEYGRKSIMSLYGVEFNQEGQVHSINDIYSEKTVQYLARDYDILIDQDDVEGFRNLMYERQLTGQFTDNYMASLIDYQKKIQKQIQDTDALIHRVNVERGKRGIVSFGFTEIWGGGADITRTLDELTRKRKQLVIELENVNNAIISWSKSVYHTSTYFGGEGSAQHDNLRTQDNTLGGNSPYLKTRKGEVQITQETGEVFPLPPIG